MAFVDELNGKILDLWYRPEYKLALSRPRMPRVYSEFRQGGLLTVGLNPSFSPDAFARFAPDVKPDELFGWCEDVTTFDLKRAREVDAAALLGYDDYYGPFKSLGVELSQLGTPVHWQHTDAFLLRYTSDDDLPKAGLLKKGSEFTLSNLSAFGRAQLELCISIIEHVVPDLLVVANKNSATLIQERLGALWDEERGEFSVQIGGKNIPVFFSGQWTYMDRYSKDHLRWRITRVVKTGN